MKRKIVYVMGAGRSGSTVLDILLGSNPGVISTGELVHLHGRGWTENHYCACGERVSDCAFWSAVKENWSQKATADIPSYLELQRRFDRIRNVVFPARLKSESRFRDYLRDTGAIVDAILDVSGQPVLVDSSKKPPRGFFLSLLAGFDVYVIHLVRDPRGFVWSKAKLLAKDERAGVQAEQRPRALLETVVEWILANVVSALVSRRMGDRAMQVRYEDFVANPKQELERISQLCGVDFTDCLKRLDAGGTFAPGHTVAGNRVRMNRNLTLKVDEEWKDRLPSRRKRLISLVTSPWLVKYGYPLGSSATS
ncbi:MAG: sulfotransferase [Bdellovibrionales bacterium]|nr:sulfotransferase [Bdellovibrionales bacterium]